MKRFLLTATLLALGLTLAPEALAQKRGSRGRTQRSGSPTRSRVGTTRRVTAPRTVSPRFTPRKTTPTVRRTFVPKRTVTPKVLPKGNARRPLPFPKVLPRNNTRRPLPFPKVVSGKKVIRPTPRRRVIVGKGYHLKTGHKFTHGHYYRGHRHYHWRYVCWSKRYGCKCYYCPSAACWYYYHPVRHCYYPINYLTVAVPPAVEVPAGAPLAPTEFTPGDLPPAPDAVPLGG